MFQVKEENLARYCKCGGEFENTLSISDFKQKLNTFSNIARFVPIQTFVFDFKQKLNKFNTLHQFASKVSTRNLMKL